MKAYTEYIWMSTKNRKEIVNISEKIHDIVKKSKVKDGFCLISSMHITSSIFVNDEESGLKQDFLEWLEKLAPFNQNYKHHRTGEDNADAHLKRTIMGHQVILPITNFELDLGPWEQIFYGEFDGQRKKRIIVKILGE